MNMKLIIGGAYQGKLDYAKEHFGVEKVFTCGRDLPELDFSKDAIYGLEDFVLACVRDGVEAKDYLMEHREELEDQVIICTDVSQGIVPMEKEPRDMREMAGRAMVWLAKEADCVVRVFCGLGQEIKGKQ